MGKVLYSYLRTGLKSMVCIVVVLQNKKTIQWILVFWLLWDKCIGRKACQTFSR